MKYMKVTVRVVETMTGKGMPFDTIHDAADWVATLFCKITGGVTFGSLGTGMWVDDKGTVVREMGMNIETLTNNPDLIPSLREVARDLRGWTGQDCVLFTVEAMSEVSFV